MGDMKSEPVESQPVRFLVFTSTGRDPAWNLSNSDALKDDAYHSSCNLTATTTPPPPPPPRIPSCVESPHCVVPLRVALRAYDSRARALSEQVRLRFERVPVPGMSSDDGGDGTGDADPDRAFKTPLHIVFGSLYGTFHAVMMCIACAAIWLAHRKEYGGPGGSVGLRSLLFGGGLGMTRTFPWWARRLVAAQSLFYCVGNYALFGLSASAHLACVTLAYWGGALTFLMVAVYLYIHSRLAYAQMRNVRAGSDFMFPPLPAQVGLWGAPVLFGVFPPVAVSVDNDRHSSYGYRVLTPAMSVFITTMCLAAIYAVGRALDRELVRFQAAVGGGAAPAAPARVFVPVAVVAPTFTPTTTITIAPKPVDAPPTITSAVPASPVGAKGVAASVAVVPSKITIDTSHIDTALRSLRFVIRGGMVIAVVVIVANAAAFLSASPYPSDHTPSRETGLTLFGDWMFMSAVSLIPPFMLWMYFPTRHARSFPSTATASATARVIPSSPQPVPGPAPVSVPAPASTSIRASA